MQGLFNFLIPLAIAATAIVLGMGLWQMFKGGNPSRSNQLMRWRILLQATAVLLIATAAFLGLR